MKKKLAIGFLLVFIIPFPGIFQSAMTEDDEDLIYTKTEKLQARNVYADKISDPRTTPQIDGFLDPVKNEWQYNVETFTPDYMYNIDVLDLMILDYIFCLTLLMIQLMIILSQKRMLIILIYFLM